MDNICFHIWYPLPTPSDPTAFFTSNGSGTHTFAPTTICVPAVLDILDYLTLSRVTKCNMIQFMLITLQWNYACDFRNNMIILRVVLRRTESVGINRFN
jgi:hypothetical protein